MCFPSGMASARVRVSTRPGIRRRGRTHYVDTCCAAVRAIIQLMAGDMFTGWGGQISEDHGLTDQWIDIWNGKDGSNKYTKLVGNSRAYGTKCIGTCCNWHVR